MRKGSDTCTQKLNITIRADLLNKVSPNCIIIMTLMPQ